MIPINIVNKSSNPTPAYQTKGSAGMDLSANLDSPVFLEPMYRLLIPTGLFVEIPLGYEGQIRPRSGLSLKRGLTCVNAVGTIDSDYRGELMVAMINLSTETQIIEHGERIAQFVLAKHETIEWNEVLVLNQTERGAGGFGSTDDLPQCNCGNDIEAVKQHKRIKLKLFLFSFMRSALYWGICTSVMIWMDNKGIIDKYLAWWIGSVMMAIYAKIEFKRD